VRKTQPAKVDLLILGAGWTSTFLIPLLEKEKITYAATTTTGRDGTYKFKFEHDGKEEESNSDNLHQYAALPTAKTMLITFPITSKSGTRHLCNSYIQTHGEQNEPYQWIQLGSTGIFSVENQDLWVTRHSKYDTENPRAIAEDELLQLGGCVLNLSGLWGGERLVKHWVDRVARSKEMLKGKGSLHMIHGEDVSRAIVAVHRSFLHAARQRFVSPWSGILHYRGVNDGVDVDGFVCLRLVVFDPWVLWRY
jgi:hypothetical protein